MGKENLLELSLEELETIKNEIVRNIEETNEPKVVKNLARQQIEINYASAKNWLMKLYYYAKPSDKIELTLAGLEQYFTKDVDIKDPALHLSHHLDEIKDILRATADGTIRTNAGL